MAFVRRLVAADPAVAEACALGVGHERMMELAEAAQQEKEWWVATHTLIAASLPAKSGLRPRQEEEALLLRFFGCEARRRERFAESGWPRARRQQRRASPLPSLLDVVRLHGL